MKKLLLFFLCLIIIVGCDTPNDSEINEEQSIVEVNLSVSNAEISVGDSLQITMKVSNTSDEEIIFYMDTGESKYLPNITLNITPELYDPPSGVYNYGYGCWIEEENFIYLKPNQPFEVYNNSTELFAKYYEYFKTVGTYKVSVTIDFDNVGIINWPKEEGEKEKLEEMFNRIPTESFTSNEIEVTIK